MEIGAINDKMLTSNNFSRKNFENRRQAERNVNASMQLSRNTRKLIESWKRD